MNGKNVFRQRFTRIEGLSSIRRLPRIGKIKLGIKIESKTKKDRQGNPVTYPKETNFFVCPPEIKKVYGDEPKELNIVFPVNDPEVIFPQCYKWYGSSKGLKCRGDGINAIRLNEDTGEMEERTCPCDLLENGKCKQRASLIFMMPGIKIGGVYQIDLSSYHSIVDINSGIDYARALVGDRIVFLPFKLKRVPKETHNEGKKQIHYTLQLELNITAQELTKIQEGQRLFAGQNKRYEIEAPNPEDDINPSLGNEETIEDDDLEETEEEIKAREAKAAEKKAALAKEYEESKARTAQLKKEIEAGKHDIKPLQEAKVISQDKQEEENILATESQIIIIYGAVVCEKCGTKVYGYKCSKCQNIDLHIFSEGIIHEPSLNRADFDKELKPTLFPGKLTSVEADKIILWWRTVLLKRKEESKQEEAETIEPIIEGTKEEKIKVAQEIVNRPGKLEVKDEGALFQGEKIAEEDIPGSSPANAIPFKSKAR